MTGERYDDVIVFWVGDEADKQSLIDDQDTPFFTTAHFDGHPSVLLRDRDLPALTHPELAEVIQDAWLSRASARRAADWLKSRGLAPESAGQSNRESKHRKTTVTTPDEAGGYWRHERQADRTRPRGRPRDALAGQPGHPPGAAAGLRRRGRQGARHRAARRADAGARGRRPAGERLRARADRDAVRPVLRHGHRRHAPGGAGGRLAGQRLGPERGDAPGDARRTRPSRTSRARGCSTCSACQRTAASASSPARRCRTSPAWPPRGTRCCAAPAGTSRATACPARRGSACSSAPSGTTRSTWPCATWASARRSRSPPTTRAASTPAPWRTRSASCRPAAPAIVVLQAGNVHSGAFDPFGPAIEVAHRARRLGARRRRVRPVRRRVAADPAPDGRLRAGRLVDHRRAQDAQRALRLRHRDRRRPRRAARRHGHARRLPDPGRGGRPVRDRARDVPPRPGVHRLGRAARTRPLRRGRPGGRPAAGTPPRSPTASPRSTAPASRTTWCTPRCAPPSAPTSAPRPSPRALLADGTAWMSGSRWRGKTVLRVSVSNWSTTDDDVARSLDALRKAAAP